MTEREKTEVGSEKGAGAKRRGSRSDGKKSERYRYKYINITEEKYEEGIDTTKN